MAETTKNYGLVTPSVDEFYDVGVHNGNMERLDRALQDLEAGKADLDSPVFTGMVKVPQPSEVPADDEAATVKFVKENGQGMASSVEISEDARQATGAAEDNVDAALVSVGSSMAGKKVEGLTLKTAVDTETGAAIEEVAKTGAEIFNDYEERVFTPAGFASLGNVATGKYSHAQGSGTTAIGDCSHAEGSRTEASGKYSHAEGYRTKANAAQTHVEGINTEANANGAHAEGYNTVASGQDSHAEGAMTAASGLASHAEGQQNTSSGNSSHAEGFANKAIGDYSHAEGHDTIAASNIQHTQGKHNIEDAEGKYAHIVGNGTGNMARSNAHTLDWDGNAWFAGEVTVGAEKKPLVTEESLQTALPSPTESGTILYSTGEGVRRNIPFLIGEPKPVTGLAVEATDQYIYKLGNEYSEITGGWNKASGNATVSINANGISINANNGNQAFVATTKKVDLSRVEKIRCRISQNTKSAQQDANRVRICSEITGDGIIAEAKFNFSGEQIIELDIPKMAAEPCFVFISGNSKSGSGETIVVTIKEVYLDKYDGAGLHLTWTNPTDLLIPQTVHIRRSSEAYPATLEEGVEVYRGSDESCLDETADLSTDQYYTAWVDNSMVAKTDESMRMKYEASKGYLMLYDHGDECVDVTGGWVCGGSGTLTNEDELVLSDKTVMGNGFVSTVNTIDLTGYSHLVSIAKLSNELNEMAGNVYVHSKKEFVDRRYITPHKYAQIFLEKRALTIDLDGDEGNKYYIEFCGSNRITTLYGVFILCTDDYIPWLRAGNLSPSDYPTLDSLLADETAMDVLMNSSTAVDRMIRYTGTVMAGVTNSTVAMTALDRSSYALSKAMKNPDWYKFMMMSPVAQEVLDASAIKVPTMTSNTTPSGTCRASSELYDASIVNHFAAYKAFDSGTSADLNSRWCGGADITKNYWIEYEFESPIYLYKIQINGQYESASQYVKHFHVEGSNDGINFERLSEQLLTHANASISTHSIEFHENAYKIIRIVTEDTWGTNYVVIQDLFFYGKELINV